ncbi:MAG TPA: ribonuclease H-like domain-containing protein [Fimbriimonadaceae bacterium]|nr:ribonuclease H-like domain-containing protein [Fimbriimonadaceae bacterium]
MLPQTFVHVPGIGRTTERSLWSQGCRDWSTYLSSPLSYSIGSACRTVACDELKRSNECLQEGRHQYFQKGLGMAEAWRAFPHFEHSCAYLDIETEGGAGADAVTMIGIYDGSEFTCLIKGENLENFRDLISRFSLIVTFFGAGFDLPMLQKRFPGLQFDQIHIDLCPTLKRIGFKGGLKKIEREAGIQRSPETAGLSGLDAVRLWRQYARFGRTSALETLIAYNREDVVNLQKLARLAYRRLSEESIGSVQQTLELAGA